MQKKFVYPRFKSKKQQVLLGLHMSLQNENLSTIYLIAKKTVSLKLECTGWNAKSKPSGTISGQLSFLR